MTPIPVCIVEYRNRAAADRCIDSVCRQCLPMLWLLHDNTETNIGYTAAMNTLLLEAIEKSQSPYAVLLNQDVQLHDTTAIRNAIDFMDSHPRCAIAGFKQLDSSDPDIITHGGCGSPYPAGQHLTGRVSNGDCAESKPQLWLNGAAVIVRLDFVRDCGLMDERMFLVGSDSEWCIRAWLSGRWQCWYCAGAVCLHDAHGSSREPDAGQQEIIRRDMEVWAEVVGKQMEAVTQLPSSLRDLFDGSVSQDVVQQIAPTP